jgi:hypothetical protein
MEQKDKIAALKIQTNNVDDLARAEARAALTLANSIEGHSRRWAIRILGIAAPEEIETTEYTKYIVTDFIREELNLTQIGYDDIDCAHRVGREVDGNQTILVRFHARDHADLVLAHKSRLKGTDFVVYEDAPVKQRTVLNNVKRHPKVESAWMAHGKIWAIKKSGGRKFKINVFDDIEDALK